MNNSSLTLVVHGESGVGKSYLADSAPGPRLILDVEGGVRFTPSKKKAWVPSGPPPELAADESAVVTVKELRSIQDAFAWLIRGQHAFRSVVIDSLSEVQKRSIDDIAGTEQMKLQDYGALFRKIDSMVRAFRDLTMHETKPVDVVVFVTGTQEKGSELHPVMRPALVGKMSEQLGYSVDVMGFLSLHAEPDGTIGRRIQFAQLNGIAAKDRTGRLGVSMDDPTVPKMLETIYGKEAKVE